MRYVWEQSVLRLSFTYKTCIKLAPNNKIKSQPLHQIINSAKNSIISLPSLSPSNSSHSNPWTLGLMHTEWASKASRSVIFPNTVFLYIAVGVVETAFTGKILVPYRREGRNIFIDSHIGLWLSFSIQSLVLAYQLQQFSMLDGFVYSFRISCI